MAVEAVQLASVSGANSLLTGKRTGNFTKLATSAENLYQKTPVPRGFSSQIPYATEQGIIWSEQGWIKEFQCKNRELDTARWRQLAADERAAIRLHFAQPR